MDHFKKIVSLLLCLALLVCLFVSCGTKEENGDSGDQGLPNENDDHGNSGENDATDEKGDTAGSREPEESGSASGNAGTVTEKVNYTLKISTAGGMNMEGIICYIRTDANGSVAARGVTDEGGTVRVELDPSNTYSVELSDVPNGYDVKDSYALSDTETNIVLTSQVMPNDGYRGAYALGDVIHDVTLTTTDGNTVQLSELMKEKKMVMLNFWYVNCYFCGLEFPGMNSAYETYCDCIEILAINDDPSDSEAYAASYKEEMGLSFPVVKDNNTLTLSQFGAHGYPTSVLIDRYGVICAIEVGAVSSEALMNAFKHFTAENYRQQLMESIGDL